MENAQKTFDRLADILHLQGIDVEFQCDADEVSLFFHGDFKQYINIAHMSGLHAIQKVLEHVNWADIDDAYEGK